MRMKWFYWALGGAALYMVYRTLSPAQPHLTRQVARKLPVAKPLPTIPDVEGNYDIDGTSFDTEGVIVSGDASKSLSPL